MAMTAEVIKQELLEQIPLLIEQDPAFRITLVRMLRGEFAPKSETESRFDRMMEELKQQREKIDQTLKLIEHKEEIQERKWEAQERKWEEWHQEWQDYKQEQSLKWEAQERKWEAQEHKWEAQEHKWEENKQELLRVHEEVMANAKRVDRSIGALGSRWGMQSERTFRNALAAILEQSFGVKVVNIQDTDNEGIVFGHPEQVEMDVLIYNGTVIACELKSSMSRSDVYTFKRKIAFYEKRYQRQVTRAMVISPMVEPRAIIIAEKLNIEVYTDSLDVPITITE